MIKDLPLLKKIIFSFQNISTITFCMSYFSKHLLHYCDKPEAAQKLNCLKLAYKFRKISSTT